MYLAPCDCLKHLKFTISNNEYILWNVWSHEWHFPSSNRETQVLSWPHPVPQPVLVITQLLWKTQYPRWLTLYLLFHPKCHCLSLVSPQVQYLWIFEVVSQLVSLFLTYHPSSLLELSDSSNTNPISYFVCFLQNVLEAHLSFTIFILSSHLIIHKYLLLQESSLSSTDAFSDDPIASGKLLLKPLSYMHNHAFLGFFLLDFMSDSRMGTTFPSS